PMTGYQRTRSRHRPMAHPTRMSAAVSLARTAPIAARTAHRVRWWSSRAMDAKASAVARVSDTVTRSDHHTPGYRPTRAATHGGPPSRTDIEPVAMARIHVAMALTATSDQM